MINPRPVLLLTRPEADSYRFAEALGQGDWELVISPVTKTVSTNNPDIPAGLSDVILTSANALKFARVPRGSTAWCVGDRTAEAAMAAGLDARSAQGDAQDLVALILSAQPVGPMVHLRGAHVATDVAGALRKAGLEVTELTTYRQEARPLSDDAMRVLRGDHRVILPIFSPRSAKALAGIEELPAPRYVVAISPSVATAAEPLLADKTTVAERPDLPAMVRATREAAASF